MLINGDVIKLKWYEPWEGLDSDDNTVDVNIEFRATVNDCINLEHKQQEIHKYYKKTKHPLNDERLLLDFICNNWAMEVKDE